ncbi:hypothetical protein BpHYR1_000409 [Brachionus plicatilis]|uniref:Uncharacterized protein n=1 Tax=Brachionus plicatilis TaxID=10195 RepID=A0A3M7QPH6_BRAPC|nr:hypothetical protein BpHYR1_000409 [Brachionus plicatilis]
MGYDLKDGSNHYKLFQHIFAELKYGLKCINYANVRIRKIPILSYFSNYFGIFTKNDLNGYFLIWIKQEITLRNNLKR